MSSKFDRSPSVRKTPAVCKAVGDSFRFVETPIGHELQWSTEGQLADTRFSWEINGTGVLSQIGNPIFQWEGIIGPILGDNAFVRIFYDDVANILTIIYIALSGINVRFQTTKIIFNIDPKKPLATDLIRFTEDSDPGTIFAQFLF